jgi:hypothetical protein
MALKQIPMMTKVIVTRCESLGMVKCPRCQRWGYNDLNYDHLCNRCMRVLLDEYKDHPSVPLILANLAERGLTPENNPIYETLFK